MSDEPVIPQAGAIPFRRGADGRLEVLLVTSTTDGSWGVPKGHIDPGDGREDTAVTESLEEGGVRGAVVGAPLGAYRYEKRGRTFEVTVFALEVRETLERWEEEAVRERRWLPAGDAADAVARPGVAALIRALIACESGGPFDGNRAR